MPGEFGLYERMHVRGYLEAFAAFRDGAGHAQIDPLAERLRLDLDRPIHELSHGNKQKVGLVQAFMHEPDLVVLDEPTQGLDPLVQQTFYALIDETKARGGTVFLSSHILPEVERVCDRVGIIREGRLLTVDDVGDLKSKALRSVIFHFAEPVDASMFAPLPSVVHAEQRGDAVAITVQGELDEVVKEAARTPSINVETREPSLEEIFLRAYRDGDESERAAGESRCVRSDAPRSAGASAWPPIATMYAAFYPPSPRARRSCRVTCRTCRRRCATSSASTTRRRPATCVRSSSHCSGRSCSSCTRSAPAHARSRERRRSRSLDLLLSTPLTRTQIVRDKAIALLVAMVGLAAFLFVVVVVIGRPFDLTVPVGNVAAACVMLLLLGLAFGSLALAVGCATGRKTWAYGVTGVVAVATYILNVLAPTVSALAWTRPASPFRWYLEPDPLTTGLHPPTWRSCSASRRLHGRRRGHVPTARRRGLTGHRREQPEPVRTRRERLRGRRRAPGRRRTRPSPADP